MRTKNVTSLVGVLTATAAMSRTRHTGQPFAEFEVRVSHPDRQGVARVLDVPVTALGEAAALAERLAPGAWVMVDGHLQTTHRGLTVASTRLGVVTEQEGIV